MSSDTGMKFDSERTWKELTDEKVQGFFKICADRADDLTRAAGDARTDLAKYLFAANSGAAAGLFVLLRSSGSSRWHLLAFALFIAGTFFVGVGYFIFARWVADMSDKWTEDFNSLMRSEITLGKLDERHRRRHASDRKKWAWRCFVLSFVILIAGGVVAGIPFWSTLTGVVR